MATDRENLITRRAAVCQQIADLSKNTYDRPNVGGGQPDFTGKIDSLYKELDQLDKMIARADAGFELMTEADT